MVDIPWPLTNAPGDEAQEGAGILINVFAERRGDEQAVIWRRAPGTKVFVVEASAGTANATAIVIGISSVVNGIGSAAGTATAVGAGGTLQVLATVGQAHGTATATAVGST
jgi:hypothetical protein